ncbi:hypothetical protein THAOC_27148, partial [Thalassiosira oceanica]
MAGAPAAAGGGIFGLLLFTGRTPRTVPPSTRLGRARPRPPPVLMSAYNTICPSSEGHREYADHVPLPPLHPPGSSKGLHAAGVRSSATALTEPGRIDEVYINWTPPGRETAAMSSSEDQEAIGPSVLRAQLEHIREMEQMQTRIDGLLRRNSALEAENRALGNRCKSLERSIEVLSKDVDWKYSAPPISRGHWLERGFDDEYA